MLAVGTSLEKGYHPGQQGNHPGATGNHPGATGTIRVQQATMHPGATGNHPGTMGNHPGTMGNRSRAVGALGPVHNCIYGATSDRIFSGYTIGGVRSKNFTNELGRPHQS